MENIIYCLEILKDKHLILCGDEKYFHKMQLMDEKLICIESKKKIESIANNSLLEIDKKLKKSEVFLDENQSIRYDNLTYYFDIENS